MDSHMRMDAVSLRVKDLDLALSFYVGDFGLRILRRADAGGGEIVELGTGEHRAEPLLILRYDSNARPAPPNAAGLYHYAILLPDRKSLAAAYLALGNAGVTFDGFADHLVSEALYLTDPEGNGIEIYADRPKDRWRFGEDGRVEMATQPLDLDSLVKEAPKGNQAHLVAFPGKTRIGHIHLKVTDLKRSLDFYHRLLGFELMSDWGSAAFVSVAGYHHHIGMNTWESLGGPSFSEGFMGLEYFAIHVTDVNYVHELADRLQGTSSFQSHDFDRLMLSDPDGIRILIKA
jgi:catechol 2,3-dioxygenase